MISQNNKHFIEAKKLKQKKYREEKQCFLVEGEKLLKEALRYNINVFEVYCTEEALDKYNILRSFPEAFVVERKMICDLSDTVTPQGIVAVCETPKAKRAAGKAIILENIQDPANVGAILRSAAATGYLTVYICDSADPFSYKALRAGMSAQFIVDIICCPIEEAVNSNKDMYCADMAGEDVFALESVNPNHVIVFGNEGNGVSAGVREKCKAVSLRMENNIESLNVASAAAVIMYNLSNR